MEYVTNPSHAFTHLSRLFSHPKSSSISTHLHTNRLTKKEKENNHAHKNDRVKRRSQIKIFRIHE